MKETQHFSLFHSRVWKLLQSFHKWNILPFALCLVHIKGSFCMLIINFVTEKFVSFQMNHFYAGHIFDLAYDKCINIYDFQTSRMTNISFILWHISSEISIGWFLCKFSMYSDRIQFTLNPSNSTWQLRIVRWTNSTSTSLSNESLLGLWQTKIRPFSLSSV